MDQINEFYYPSNSTDLQSYQFGKKYFHKYRPVNSTFSDPSDSYNLTNLMFRKDCAEKLYTRKKVVSSVNVVSGPNFDKVFHQASWEVAVDHQSEDIAETFRAELGLG